MTSPHHPPHNPPRAQPLMQTPQRRAILRQLHSKPSVKGAAIALALLLLTVLLAPLLAPQNPYDLGALDLMDGRLAPGSQAASGGATGWAPTTRGATCSAPSCMACGSA